VVAPNPVLGTSLALAVEVVHVHRDGWDYVAILGGALAAVAASIALFFAVKAGKAADATQKAAETLSSVVQSEAAAIRAERARRADPLAMVHANYESVITPETDGDVILTLGFRNEGNRPAERLGVNLLIPATLSFSTCDQYGAATESGRVHFTPESLSLDGDKVEDGPGSFYWDENVGPLDPLAVNKVQFFRIHKPPFGIHVLKAVLMQQDIPGGQRVWLWRLRIPEEGLVYDPDPIGGPTPPMRVFPPGSFE
jgi:hypothetical protein